MEKINCIYLMALMEIAIIDIGGIIVIIIMHWGYVGEKLSHFQLLFFSCSFLHDNLLREAPRWQALPSSLIRLSL